jgi:hypothetical protein
MFLSNINSLLEILADKNVKGVKAVKPLQGSPINLMKIRVAIYDGNPLCNNQKQVHPHPNLHTYHNTQ